MANWYMKHGSKEVGPGTAEQLCLAFAKGKVNADTLIRQEDSTEWVTFGGSGLIDPSDKFHQPEKNSVRKKSSEGNDSAVKNVNSLQMSMSNLRGDEFRKKATYNSQNPVVYASFGERLAAVVIDVVIFLIGNLMLMSVGIGGGLLSLLLPPAYFIFLQHQWGYTVGRKIMGMHIEMENRDRPTLGVLSIRYLSSILSSLILLIGYFIALGDSKVRTLHDRISGTVVVKD